MTFLEILQQPLTNLPIEQDNNSSFREILKNKLNEFDNLIQSSTDLSEPVNNIPLTDEPIKKRINALINGILETIDKYYAGDINQAYNKLSTTLKDANISNYLNKQYAINPHTDFFRLRIANGNYPLLKKDLFHIPFDKRGKVATQRFSIPGLPSLYLSNCTYIAWEELRRPTFNEIQAVRLQNLEPLIMLDLTTDAYSRNKHLTSNTGYGWNLLYKIMIWPLIAACSVKVKNSTDAFKPEYIIPQLLLQWINKEKVDGIVYSSTHLDLSKSASIGAFKNFVLPVKSLNNETGHCEELRKIFRSTDVLPMQLRQFAIAGGRFDNQASIPVEVNREVESLELIKNNVQRYSSTSFGALEHSLNDLSLQEIYE